MTPADWPLDRRAHYSQRMDFSSYSFLSNYSTLANYSTLGNDQNSNSKSNMKKKSVNFSNDDPKIRTYHNNGLVARTYIPPDEDFDHLKKRVHYLLSFWGLPKSKRSSGSNASINANDSDKQMETSNSNIILQGIKLDEMKLNPAKATLSGWLKMKKPTRAFESMSTNALPVSEILVQFSANDWKTTHSIKAQLEAPSRSQLMLPDHKDDRYLFELNIGRDSPFFDDVYTLLKEMLSQNQDHIQEQCVLLNGFISFQLPDYGLEWEFAYDLARIYTTGNPRMKELLDVVDGGYRLNEDVDVSTCSEATNSRANSIENLAMATDEALSTLIDEDSSKLMSTSSSVSISGAPTTSQRSPSREGDRSTTTTGGNSSIYLGMYSYPTSNRYCL